MLERYGTTLAPFGLCPPPLFGEIVRINRLRLQATKNLTQGTGIAPELAHEASEIFQRIHNFSSEQWANTKPCAHQDWVLIGNIYQAAVTLYCLSSLQSVSVLATTFPPTPGAECTATSQARRLQHLLARAVACPKLKRATLWPLVVLGTTAQAIHESFRGGMRDFVAAQLPVLSRDAGTYVPLTAKSVLEKFWASGQTRWDACFDRPYAFVIQIALDTSRLIGGVGSGPPVG